VGAQLTVMLRPKISTLSCYGFGTPACVDEDLMIPLLDCMVSVVNRDDIVPRLSVHNVQHLAHATLCAGQTAKTKAWMYEDWKAVQDIQRIIELRRRESPAAASSADTAEAGETQTDDDEHKQKLRLLMEAGVQEHVAERALKAEGGDLTKALLRATDEEHNRSPNSPAAPVSAPPPAPPQQPAGAPLTAQLQTGFQGFLGGVQRLSAKASEQIQQLGAAGGPGSSSGSADARASHEDAQKSRFYVPGQIIHLFQHNGLRRAALTPGTHDSLMRINVTPHMLDDHMSTSYEEALRQACLTGEVAPRWESFEERSMCACCQSDFNWAFVLKSEPQRMLARNNCYCCGKVVCEGCSQTKQAHPHLGFLQPVRTCDACRFSPHTG